MTARKGGPPEGYETIARDERILPMACAEVDQTPRFRKRREGMRHPMELKNAGITVEPQKIFSWRRRLPAEPRLAMRMTMLY